MSLTRSVILYRNATRHSKPAFSLQRWASSSTSQNGTASNRQDNAGSTEKKNTSEKPKKSKSMAEADEEMRKAMEGLSGDGGINGAELEDGKQVGMKRGVRDNMFRYI